MGILVKIHKGSSEIVAICDKELLGKVFSDGKYELKVSEHFYNGEELNEDKIEKIMKESNNLNIVGENSINLALKLKRIKEENIINIGEVKHAQAVTL